MEFVILETALVDDFNAPLSHYCYGQAQHVICDDPSMLSQAFERIDALSAEGYFLVGGVSYELAYAFQQFKDLRQEGEPLMNQMPLLHFIAFEHHDQVSKLQIDNIIAEHLLSISEEGVQQSHFVYDQYFSLDKEQYFDKLKYIHQQIHAGNTYQVNFTAQYHFKYQGDPVALYAALRSRQQVNYAALFNLNDYQILSFSPELFFKKQGQVLTTKPMKGTMPRHSDFEQDQANRLFLQKDPKSLAENLMIVDLLRNDLNRIAEPGSVVVDDLFCVESYATVHQMVSSIRCKVAEKTAFQDLLQALFPCGSITGAPKYRTMQVIQSLEHECRQIYTGALGYISADNDMCFNVPIRTLCLKNGQGVLGVGGGIVADSKVEDEWQEMHLKAKFMHHLGVDFELLECLCYHPNVGYLSLTKHLLKLKQSAKRFGFVFPEQKLKENLQALVKKFKTQAYNITIKLFCHGEFSIDYEHMSLPQTSCVAILSREAINEQNILLQYHSTAKCVQSVYAQACRDYLRSGIGEVLFLNTQGVVTQGVSTHVFIVKSNVWYTAPVACGVRDTVFRDQILQDMCVKEKLMTQHDLFEADEVYLGNSFMGLKLAEVLSYDACVNH